jgi:hypothetical protein
VRTYLFFPSCCLSPAEERLFAHRRPPFSQAALNDAPTPPRVNCVRTTYTRPLAADWNSWNHCIPTHWASSKKIGVPCLRVPMEHAGTAVALDGSLEGDCAENAIPHRECGTFTGLIVSSEEHCAV